MFTEPLFLHREAKNTKVKLENLFVLQEFDVYARQSAYSDRAMQNLSELFCEFISRTDNVFCKYFLEKVASKNGES
jgi:hypothetical protein